MVRKRGSKKRRQKISFIQAAEMFSTEEKATEWFEAVYWPEERCCGRCGSTRTREVKNRKPMPYWCTDCRKYFSVRTGTPLACSNVPLRKWGLAMYLELTSLKSIASTKLANDIGVSKTTAWFMLHRIREAWNRPSGDEPFDGPVEVDECYMGGKRRNMSNAKRKTLTGRGAVGKTAVAGIKDRRTNQVVARVVPNTKSDNDVSIHHGAHRSRDCHGLHGRRADIPSTAES